MTMTMKKDLKAIKKEIKTLSKKVDNLIAAAGKPEKAKPVKRIEAKPVEKTVAKKTPPKAKPAKKVAVKKPAAKKVVKVTAADTVFAVIKESKNGVNTATLVEKTGFNRQKIYNIVMNLKKKGMVTSPEKGLYVKA
jgi:fibronectin type 3 domain-containing protein